MADTFGTDLDCITDIGPSMALAANARNMGNAIARRLTTPRGSLIYDPDYGFDVRALLNAGTTDNGAAITQSQIANEVVKDERIGSCDPTFVFVQSTGQLIITLSITLSNGAPFTLVLSATALTVTILQVQ